MGDEPWATSLGSLDRRALGDEPWATGLGRRALALGRRALGDEQLFGANWRCFFRVKHVILLLPCAGSKKRGGKSRPRVGGNYLSETLQPGLLMKKQRVCCAKRDSTHMLRDQRRLRAGGIRANARFALMKHQYLDRHSYVASLHRLGNPGCGGGRVAAAVRTKSNAKQVSNGLMC